jgi:hypothetical protein
MKAIVEPKIGAWDLGDFVKDPNGQGFNGFLKTIKKHVIELRNTRHILIDEICVRLKHCQHLIENIVKKISIVTV